MPPPCTPIVGRGTEIDELIELLDTHRPRVVTLVGTGGIGKSRLAIEDRLPLALAQRKVLIVSPGSPQNGP